MQVYIKGDYGIDTIVKTLNTLRRKKVEIIEINSKDVEDTHLDIFITLKETDYKTAENAKQLLEKLYCLKSVEIID